MKAFQFAILVAGATVATFSSAHATVIGTFSPVLPADNYTAPDSSTGNVILGAQGTQSQGGATVGYSPFGSSDTTSQYVDIVNGTATYNFGSLYTGVSFVWGSPDSYNTVTFYDGTTSVGTFAGSSVPGTSYATLTSTDPFNSVVFSSSQAAFEISNVSAVPLPPALYLFMAALAGLGGLAFFKKRPDDSFPGAAAA